MNIYIISDVLYDYTAGMAVIAAESMEQCEQIFIEEFAPSESSVSRVQEDFNTASIQVIENVNHSSGVVNYVYGGG